MINREELDRIPTSVREEIVDFLRENLQNEEHNKYNASSAYIISQDEKQRASALMSHGSIETLTTLINLFKTKGMGEVNNAESAKDRIASNATDD